MAAVSDDKAWLSTSEAAQRLGVTRRTIYRLIDLGDLPAYKLGRVIRIREEDMQAFMEAARIQPGTLDHLHTDRADNDDAPVG